MTKQPFLTGFPRTVLASSKRRMQAAIRGQRALSVRRSLCGYAPMFARVLPATLLEEIDPTDRQRHFGHVPVFRAWLARILEANASCSKAVSLIRSWSRSADMPVPSSDTGGDCQARRRIDMDFLAAIHGKTCQSLDAAIRPSDPGTDTS